MIHFCTFLLYQFPHSAQIITASSSIMEPVSGQNPSFLYNETTVHTTKVQDKIVCRMTLSFVCWLQAVLHHLPLQFELRLPKPP